MLSVLLKGVTSNKGCKELSRRDTACRNRRLKVQRFWLPKLSQPSSRYRGLAMGQHPNTVKIFSLQIHKRHTEKLLLPRQMDLAREVQLKKLTCC